MKKGIMIVFISNIVNLVFSVISSFILPRYLSVESYGFYKIYQLYVGYLGIMHFGYVDGIYLKYGGKNLIQIDSKEIIRSSATLRSSQFILAVVALSYAIYFHSIIGFMLAISFVPVNMISFYKNLYQATGEFKDYGSILVIAPVFVFLADVVLLFFIKTDNYIAYILVVILSNLLLYIILEYKSKRLFGKVKILAFDIRQIKENVTSGITLTIGNFASIMITSIDRWCIQAWMQIQDFSYYSFAVSVENLFNVCVSSVTTTLYNYLCKLKEIGKIIEIKSFCTIIGIYLVSIAFPVKFIIQVWLTKYIESIECMFILICAHSFYFVTKAIYVNLYKARGQQRHYLYQMLLVLIIAVVTNIIAFQCISKTKESFAYASLGTAIIWYLICYFEVKEIQGNIRETILILLSSCIFLFTGIKVHRAIAGFAFYIVAVTLLMLYFEKDIFICFIKKGITFIIYRKITKEVCDE